MLLRPEKASSQNGVVRHWHPPGCYQNSQGTSSGRRRVGHEIELNPGLSSGAEAGAGETLVPASEGMRTASCLEDRRPLEVGGDLQDR